MRQRKKRKEGKVEVWVPEKYTLKKGTQIETKSDPKKQEKQLQQVADERRENMLNKIKIKQENKKKRKETEKKT